MMQRLSFVLLPFVFGAAISSPATAQDDDIKNRRWFIDVSYSLLKPITLKDPASPARTRTFWYVLMKLKNKTGKARPLDLTARALTPQAKRSPVARPGLYTAATQAIAKRHRIKDLANILAVAGKLEDGATKDVVIVFPSLSNLANKIDVRVAGLTNSIYHEGKNVWREFTELSMKFHRIGDEYDTPRNRVEDKGKSWVEVKPRTKIR